MYEDRIGDKDKDKCGLLIVNLSTELSRTWCIRQYIQMYRQWTKVFACFQFSIYISYKTTICQMLILKSIHQVRVITVFTVFRLLTDFVCLYNYEFWLSLCKIVRSSVILLLPLFTPDFDNFYINKNRIVCSFTV